jgi:hypothetical protein
MTTKTVKKHVEYSHEIAAEIVERYAAGETLLHITQTSDWMPDIRTVHRWKGIHAQFKDLLADAREAHADALASEIVEIADTERDASKARNRMDARKWYAAKLNPNKYGDKLELNLNKTISISTALNDAKARTLRPVSDQLILPSGEAIDLSSLIEPNASDKQSNAATLDEQIDIFA